MCEKQTKTKGISLLSRNFFFRSKKASQPVSLHSVLLLRLILGVWESQTLFLSAVELLGCLHVLSISNRVLCCESVWDRFFFFSQLVLKLSKQFLFFPLFLEEGGDSCVGTSPENFNQISTLTPSRGSLNNIIRTQTNRWALGRSPLCRRSQR